MIKIRVECEDFLFNEVFDNIDSAWLKARLLSFETYAAVRLQYYLDDIATDSYIIQQELKGSL